MPTKVVRLVQFEQIASSKHEKNHYLETKKAYSMGAY